MSFMKECSTTSGMYRQLIFVTTKKKRQLIFVFKINCIIYFYKYKNWNEMNIFLGMKWNILKIFKILIDIKFIMN